MKLDKEVLSRQIPSGIYFHNTSNRYVFLIETTLDSGEGLSHQQYNIARQDRRALAMVGYPSKKYFKDILCAEMIHNWPITLDNINNSNTIFVPQPPH